MDVVLKYVKQACTIDGVVYAEGQCVYFPALLDVSQYTYDIDVGEAAATTLHRPIEE